ncbi:hypothetical protein Tco_0458425 [Tanacetum coccineum]
MTGSPMYLTASRHDIQFSTCLCARYHANPKESHLIAAKRIFRYPKGTPSLGLWYPKCSGFDLKGYSDSDYAGCNMYRKITSGACELLGGNLEDIIIKLNKKTREKVVPYYRFLSLLIQHKIKEQAYGDGDVKINPTQVFSVNNCTLKPNQPKGAPFTDHVLAICAADKLVVFKAPKTSSKAEKKDSKGKKTRAKTKSSKIQTRSKSKATKDGPSKVPTGS